MLAVKPALDSNRVDVFIDKFSFKPRTFPECTIGRPDKTSKTAEFVAAGDKAGCSAVRMAFTAATMDAKNSSEG